MLVSMPKGTPFDNHGRESMGDSLGKENVMQKYSIGTGRKFLSALLAIAVLVTVWGDIKVSGRIETDTIKNPEYHMGSDITDWSYIYFGSYPQTEVTGMDLTAAITGAAYDSSGDAWVNGKKYRRVINGEEYHYYQWEQIKWKVLEYNAPTVFVVADSGLDCRAYNTGAGSVTWEKSSVRQWLNGAFYQSAYSSTEREAILGSDVSNEDNPYYGTSGGKGTRDNVYLLSMKEVSNPEYGFSDDDSANSTSRRTKVSDYAAAVGAETSKESGYRGNCYWWLRSPGLSASNAAYINYYGYIYKDGVGADFSSCAVVPAMHIDLDAIRNVFANPVHNCTKEDDGTDTTDFSYVSFGSYPQAEVMGNELTSAVTGAAYDANGDAWINGIRYRRISKSDTNNSGYFGKNSYRYFKWEEIKWRVLSNNGSTLFIAAEFGLDCKDYHNTEDYVTWETSSLRSWLNGSFYNTAFNSSQQKAVIEQSVVNEENPSYGTDAGNGTLDQVILLSANEIVNPLYGFCEKPSTYSVSRQIKASDYAYVMGAGINTSGSYNGNCTYWLRSPGQRENMASYIHARGYVFDGGSSVSTHTYAVVPAILVDISFFQSGNEGGSGQKPTDPTKPGGNTKPTTPTKPGGNTKPVPKPPAAVKLTAPASFTVKLQSVNAVKLSWGKVSGAAGYSIERSTQKNQGFQKIGTTKNLSFIDKKLKKGKTYYYRVRAYSGNTFGSFSGTADKKIPGTLARPKQKKIVIKPDGKFVISWNTKKNVKKIEIQRSIDGGKYKKWKVAAAKKKKVSYSYMGFARKHRYSFRLRAYYTVDGVKIYSKYSNAYAITRN